MTRLLDDDSGRLRIRVCCGMNCSGAGGGRAFESALEEALQSAGLTGQVDVYRAHCLGECPNGPCVRVAGDRFYHMQPSDAAEFVRTEIMPRCNL